MLDRAADLIAAHGLWKGELWPGADRGCRYGSGQATCLAGALLVARLDQAGLLGPAVPAPTSAALLDDPAAEAVAQVLRRRHVRGLTDVMRWSDRLRIARRRRAVRVLRAAARRCRRG
ncbi:hypothetical protein GCM10009613_60820 [Pseudonocardia kongjuensis]|uniref:Uncharacterized protein n=1 Tax=Pseudonocardia kongjuensis TaxID=102227 RepID=A0ABP4IY52_9PSEU